MPPSFPRNLRLLSIIAVDLEGWPRASGRHVVSSVWKGASYVNEGGEGGVYLSEFVRYLVESLELVLTTAKRNLC